MRRAPSRRGGCGLSSHGKPNPDGGLPLCYACNRPGARYGSSTGWRHVGSGPFWSALEQWSASIGATWVHARDITKEPLIVGECICGRLDCVISMYKRFCKQQAKAEKGSLVTMATGQSSPLDRYPSTSFQVCIKSPSTCLRYQMSFIPRVSFFTRAH